MLGKVIYSSTREIVFRILDDVEVENVKVGNLVVITSRYNYLARVSAIQSKNLGESLLADKVAAIDSDDIVKDIDSALGAQFYYICKATVVGIVQDALYGAKSIPKFLSQVRKATARDLRFLNGGVRDVIKIGNLRDVDIPICLDRVSLITRHCGVFGKTGSGKSNTVKVILEKLIERKSPCLIFDVHSEYSRHDGLRKLSGVVVLGLDGSEDVTVSIPLEAIKTRDFKLVSSLNETQSEAVEAIRNRKKRAWIDYILSTDTKEIHQESNRQIFESTIDAVKRKLSALANQPYVGGDFNSLSYIFNAIKKRKTIVVDFGNYENNDYAIRLITTVISRYLLDRFKNSKRKRESLPETLIVLEEAHKLLSKDIAKLTIFDNIVREGRKFGLGLLVVDQMPRKIHEEIISQLNTVIIMQLTNMKDREHLVLSSENDLTDFKDEMARLDIGETIVTGISVPIPLSGVVPRFGPVLQTEREHFDEFYFNEGME
ncbi:MAG: ATP-binding protein [Candidatus Methanofastidiosia archaeon]